MVSTRHASTSRRPHFPRRAGLTLVMSALALTFAGCETLPEPPPRPVRTGNPITDLRAEAAAAPKQDRALWQYRLGAVALRADDDATAKAAFDDALLTIGGIIANSEDAKRARSLFSAEKVKTFIGEPYERVMAYYYRGILYWRDGQPDNARACFRSGQLIDSDAESEGYKSDYVLLDYLDGYATARLAGDGSDAFQRAQKNAKHALPPYDLKANVLCFVEYGRGPRKFGGGEYEEQLRFAVKDSPAHSARLRVGEQVVALPAYDDLNFQATTRGGRVMDYILGNKAVFKRNTDNVGNVALTGAAIAANNGSRDSDRAAIALGAIGLISKLASAATTPHADIRQWDNLPQRLSFAALRLPPGDHAATLEFLDARGAVLPRGTQSVTLHVAAEGDTVIFLSELKSSTAVSPN